MGPDTEVLKHDWMRKSKIDTLDNVKWRANKMGVKLIDVRFTFQPNGTVLLARGLDVDELTQDQLDMITEWRVSDAQPTTSASQAPMKQLAEERMVAVCASAWAKETGRDPTHAENRIKETTKAEAELDKEARVKGIIAHKNAEYAKDKADAMIQHLKERRKPMGISSIEASKYPHYFKDVRHLNYVDIYRLLDLFEITDQPVAHAIKKLMAAGKRGAKDADKDISEAIDCLLRRKTMNREDSRKSNNLT